YSSGMSAMRSRATITASSKRRAACGLRASYHATASSRSASARRSNRTLATRGPPSLPASLYLLPRHCLRPAGVVLGRPAGDLLLPGLAQDGGLPFGLVWQGIVQPLKQQGDQFAPLPGGERFGGCQCAHKIGTHDRAPPITVGF